MQRGKVLAVDVPPRRVAMPCELLASVTRALKSGGRRVLVECRAQDAQVWPWRIITGDEIDS